MYIVDAEKPTREMDAPPPPPIHPDYPSSPPNAIPFMNNGTPIPVNYNQTVVLQCLTSGVVSPVLIIRKVDRQTTVVGRSAQGSKGVSEHYCVPGEVCGDPVSQLEKVAFEIFELDKGAPESGSPGQTGAFLSCMGEKVNTYRPVDGRLWQSGVDDLRSSDSRVVPSSPIISTPGASNGSDNDYFGSGRNRGSSSAGGSSKSGSSSKPGRRPTSGPFFGALWQVDIGTTSVWTIVGTGWPYFLLIPGTR
jgi:recombining binding protein (suppressor of hairless)